jgi:hypothetical protein
VIKIDKTLRQQILAIMNYKELINSCNSCHYYLHQEEHICSANSFNLLINPLKGHCDFWIKKIELSSIKNITTTEHDT